MKRAKRVPLGNLNNVPDEAETGEGTKRKAESSSSSEISPAQAQSSDLVPTQLISDENDIQYQADGPKRNRRRMDEGVVAEIIPPLVILDESGVQNLSKCMETGSSAITLQMDSPSLQSPFVPIKIEKKLARQSRTAKLVNCAEYAQKMFDDLHLVQLANSFSYIYRESDINNKMRAILMDWIIEVHYKFRLLATSLWFAITITDRYLSQRRISRQSLQLLGTAALMIAVKIDETRFITPEDYIAVTDNAYTVDELVEMEGNIGSILNFDFYSPTVGSFLLRYNHLTNATELLTSISNYYAERCLLEHEMMKYPMSLMAAGCIYASRLSFVFNVLDTDMLVTRDGVFPMLLETETGFSVDVVKMAARDVLQYVRHEGITISHRLLNAVRKKYAGLRGGNISGLKVPDIELRVNLTSP